MAYNLNKNRGRCPSCVVLFWFNYVRMSAMYEEATLYQLFTRIPRPKNLSNELKLSEKKLNINIFGWQAPSGL